MRITTLLILILSIQALAAGATIHVPRDHATIQGAISAAVPGDTVLVEPGTYVETIDFLGKAIVVRSAQGAAVTTIDAAAADTAVTFRNGEGRDSVLGGFTLVNGDGHTAGAVLCYNASPTIVSNVIRSLGGQAIAAVACRNSTALVADNDISGNPVIAVFCDLGAAPEIRGNRMADNTNTDYAGGVYCSEASPVIDDNLIAGNLAGGIGCFLGSDAVITGNRILDNSNGTGAGIRCGASSPLIEGNVLERNSAPVASAIMCDDLCAARIVGNRITGHTSTDGTLYCTRGSSPVIACNLIGENSARYGGGILVSQGAAPTIVCNMIVDNVADSGAGIWCYDASPIVVNNTISGNSAHAEGGGIYCTVSSAPVVTNTILWGNSAPADPQIAVSHGSTPTFSHCLVQGGWAGAGNIDGDPLFADAAGGDFHLTWSSPCREAATAGALPPDLTVDFEKDPRNAFVTVDIGADEFFRHLYHSGNVVPGGTVTLKVAGLPAAPVLLALGAGVAAPPVPTGYGPLHLTWPITLFPIGTIGGSGIRTLTVPVPAAWQPGDEKPFQALVGPIGAAWSKLTNLELLRVE